MSTESARDALDKALREYAAAYRAHPAPLGLDELGLPSRRPWVLSSDLPSHNITPEWYAYAHPTDEPGEADDWKYTRDWETEAEYAAKVLREAAENIRLFDDLADEGRDE